jgi:hypothetical protein
MLSAAAFFSLVRGFAIRSLRIPDIDMLASDWSPTAVGASVPIEDNLGALSKLHRILSPIRQGIT